LQELVRSRSSLVALAAAAAATAVLVFAPGALANTYTPNKLGDHAPDGKCNKADCTLREAITKANGHAGKDTIVLQGGKTYELKQAPVGPTGNNADGDLDVNDPLKIISSTRGLATIDANHIDRVLDLGPLDPGSTKLELIRVKGGSDPSTGQGGGGILVDDGALKLVRSVVSGNFTDSNNGGGGILVRQSGPQPPATIVKSTIRNNRTGAFIEGGGMRIDSGDATIRESTFSGNVGNHGGGLQVYNSAVTVVNSTFAKNKATTGSGGGIQVEHSSSQLLLRSVTIARNKADTVNVIGQHGGGIAIFNNPLVTLQNSIVALNTVGSNGDSPDCYAGAPATYTSAGRNLFTSLAGCTGMTKPPNLTQSDPHLGSLDDNGGPTKTVALKSGSKAINNAGSGSPPRDQRGVTRSNPDIGAFEKR
jgi:hypothetical protein